MCAHSDFNIIVRKKARRQRVCDLYRLLCLAQFTAKSF